MLGVIKILCLLSQVSCYKPVERKIHVCDRDWSQKSLESLSGANSTAKELSLETKIEFAVGCSRVNGRQVYEDWYLEELYEAEI